MRREFFKIVGADAFVHCARFEILFGACKDDLEDFEDWSSSDGEEDSLRGFKLFSCLTMSPVLSLI